MSDPNPAGSPAQGPLFLAGLYQNGSLPLRISLCHRDRSVSPDPVWTWSPAADASLTGPQWQDLKASTSVVEVKWADEGRKVLALVGDYAVLLSVPGPQTGDRPRLEFASRLRNASGAHSAEVLPGNMLAVADNGHDPEDSGIQLYPVTGNRLETGGYVQQVPGFPSTHGLLWDRTLGCLWVTGDNKWPTSEGSQGLVRAYAYDSTARRIAPEPVVEKPVGTGWRTKEAPDEWDGPHDIAGIPGTRSVLITTEQDVYTWNVDDRTTAPVWAQQLTKFRTFSGARHEHGYPRSRFKAIGVRESGEIIYTQPTDWGPGKDYPDMVGFYDPGTETGDAVPSGQTVYKARWFAPTPGWESPPVHAPQV
ncbi:hypothetical protein [Kitasatospora purpeofusca]|uniref:hypothetical protein n=1 Tax=Kitasatospora purpeofusca TaxID=67352 RepID=UPI0036667619